jgi:prephenate dehydratase
MKIESRPVHGKPWQYRFYLDLQAARSNAEAAAALAELEKEVVDLRILGSDAAAKTSAAAKGRSEEERK